MNSYFIYSCLSICLLFSACHNSTEGKTSFESEEYELIQQSEEFSIYKKDSQFLLKVAQAFPGSTISEHYLLYPLNESIDSLKGIEHFIPYPISQIAISSTTHLGYLDALGMSNQIKSATNLNLYYSEEFIKRIENGEVQSVGQAGFDEERLIAMKPDVLFAYALNQATYNQIKDLRQSGVKVVIVNEFLERNPIQKASWLQFFASFFGEGKLKKSEAFLAEVEEQYASISKAVKSANSKPKVMMGFPWKGSWFVSGGLSYQAKFYEDAGADYIWSKYKQKASLPLDLEVVLRDGLTAEYWINPGNKLSYESLDKADPRFSQFLAFEERNIYSNYKRTNDAGANDCWEKGVVRPDLILKDLAAIFHPEIMGKHEFYFYQELSVQ